MPSPLLVARGPPVPCCSSAARYARTARRRGRLWHIGVALRAAFLSAGAMQPSGRLSLSLFVRFGLRGRALYILQGSAYMRQATTLSRGCRYVSLLHIAPPCRVRPCGIVALVFASLVASPETPLRCATGDSGDAMHHAPKPHPVRPCVLSVQRATARSPLPPFWLHVSRTARLWRSWVSRSSRFRWRLVAPDHRTTALSRDPPCDRQWAGAGGLRPHGLHCRPTPSALQGTDASCPAVG